MGTFDENSRESLDAGENQCAAWFLGVAKRILIVIVGLGIGGVAAAGVTNVDWKSRCGLDWTFAAVGSDMTFEKWLRETLEESDEQFRKDNPELFEPQFQPNSKPIVIPREFYGDASFERSHTPRQCPPMRHHIVRCPR